MDIKTAINYGLNKLEMFVDDQLMATNIELDDSLEFLIIKEILDKYSTHADAFDSVELAQKVSDYCEKLLNPSD